MAEWNAGLAVVAEPYRIADNPNWIGDRGGLVAIVHRPIPVAPQARVLKRGRGYVAAVWGNLAIIGVYAPPSWPLSSFNRLLDEISASITSSPTQAILVLGDFNAKNTLWGATKLDARGSATAEWAAGQDLRLLNTGDTSTCIRWQGESIVDISWATPAALAHIRDWKVMEDAETLSDHLYIKIRLRLPETGNDGYITGRSQRPCPCVSKQLTNPRWALKKLDMDLLMAAAAAKSWPAIPESIDPATEAEWFRQALTEICDTAMPRCRTMPVYWWSADIKEARRPVGSSNELEEGKREAPP
ncbi:uncharacterized protein LOC122534438 [Frieseomelitta varia]|uniref:uncharacterized protein LOC122534438 n=1 Tax=Frieseomelitta varia TaxID=561572 RepID=UPI001CB67CCD|nr:uncharacterized protein LOC122534438 [Frieseomelitta varia]